MNKLLELEASMKVLKLQNETPTVMDGNELLLLSRFMEYKESHPKTTQREICRLINIPESRLLTAKKRYGLTKTRRRRSKKTDDDGNPVSARRGRPRKNQSSRTVKGGNIPDNEDNKDIEDTQTDNRVHFQDKPSIIPAHTELRIRSKSAM